MKNYINILLVFLFLATSLSSCKKDFLEEKPRKSILVPATIEDIRALLDHYTRLNENTLTSFIVSDDWQTTTVNWESLNLWEQNAYLWKKEMFDPNSRSVDYISLHHKIFTANVCLDILGKMDGQSKAEIKNLRGEALVLRASTLFQLAQLYLPSPVASMRSEIKIPIHLKADINAVPKYMEISETIALVEKDLLEAFSLLNEKATVRNRPDKIVSQSFLSRVYLYQEKWEKSLEASNYVIQSHYSLMNFVQLNQTSPYPFSIFNSETIFYGVTSSFSVTASAATYINSNLYNLYAINDLRRGLFFTLDAEHKPLFKGSYIGDYNLFSGISLSEIYLTAAESAIRLGEVQRGISYLNTLAKNRYLSSQPWAMTSPEESLRLVLDERRKELVFRGTRWMDMKRLAARGDLQLPLEREINGTVYQLKDEGQFTLSLPSFELELENLFK